MVIVRFSEGKIVESRGEPDMLDLMQQLGMELKPKGEKAQQVKSPGMKSSFRS